MRLKLRFSWASAWSAALILRFLLGSDILYAQQLTESYQEIKFQVEEFLGQVNPGSAQPYLKEYSQAGLIKDEMGRERDGMYYGLNFCQDASNWFGMDLQTDTARHSAATAAAEIAMYKYFLSKLGIPSDIWQVNIDELDALGRNKFASYLPSKGYDYQQALKFGGMKRKIIFGLTQKLNNYLNANGKPSVFGINMCGAGESFVKVIMSPPGGSFAYIPSLSFRICEAKKIDPWDRALCKGWLFGRSNITKYLAGDYFVEAFWGSGSSRVRQKIKINPSDTVITITKP